LGGNTHPSSKLSGEGLNGAASPAVPTKPVFASQTMSFGMTPDAVDDPAWTGLNQTITIHVLNNDVPMMGGPLTIINVTGETKGTADSLDGTSITYTPNSNFTSGSDTFQYTVSNPMGFTDTANVTVTMVNVTGYTVEYKDNDGQWNPTPPGELWSHEELRWHITTNLTDPLPQGVDVRKQDWDEFIQGGTTWTPFAFGTGVAQGNPGVGIWALMPSATFGAFGNQTGFVATMTLADVAIAEKAIVAKIESIEFAEHVGEQDRAGELDIANELGDLRFFPDADEVGDPTRDLVDVVITISPNIATTIYLRAYDVDDPSSESAPLDPLEKPQWKADTPDNIETVTAEPQWELPETVQTIKDPNPNAVTTSVTVPFEINWIQPGNNYRVVVSGRDATEFSKLKPLTRDHSGQLFRDTNNDDRWDITILAGEPNYEPGLLNEDFSINGVHSTNLLTVWRILHVEVDRMTLPQEGTTDWLALYGSVDDVIPPGNALPSPDTSLVEEQFERAFIEVAVGTDHDSVNAWVQNMPSQALLNLGHNRGSDEAFNHWVAHIESAYEAGVSEDRDEGDQENPALGRTWRLMLLGGGENHQGEDMSYIYHEVIRDAVTGNNPTVTGEALADAIEQFVQITALHEIAHQFALGHENDDVMSAGALEGDLELNANGRFPQRIYSFNDNSLRTIREVLQP
jgi:hypothetical protein